jgi:hypothetical protein
VKVPNAQLDCYRDVNEQINAVTYTDFDDAQAAAAGDAAWKRVLDRHDAIGLSCVGRKGGDVIKATGDG